MEPGSKWSDIYPNAMVLNSQSQRRNKYSLSLLKELRRHGDKRGVCGDVRFDYASCRLEFGVNFLILDGLHARWIDEDYQVISAAVAKKKEFAERDIKLEPNANLTVLTFIDFA